MNNHETKPHDLASPTTGDYNYGGLTKREYFAAMAMLGHFSINCRLEDFTNCGEVFAKGAVAMADALIEALNVGQHTQSCEGEGK